MRNVRQLKKILQGCAAVALLLVAGCGGANEQKKETPAVTYIEVTTTPVDIEVELSGRTTAFMVSEVRPQVGGIILERLFQEGSEVKQGQQLYQIDPALYQAAVDTAKAGLMRAEANAYAAQLLARRYSGLVKDNAVSKQEYDNANAAAKQAAAEVSSAKAALETARINLEYTKVNAPISGVVGKSSVTAGALVSPGQPAALAMVQAQDPMYVDVTQSSTELLRLRQSAAQSSIALTDIKGAEATLILPDGTEYTEKGELLFSDVTVDESTGSYIIRAMFPNKNRVLLQNLYVRLKLKQAVSNSAVLLPQKLVDYNMQGNPIVSVLVKKVPAQDAKQPAKDAPILYDVVTKEITTERAIGSNWVVTKGLQAGDKVMVDGGLALRGQAATVTATLHVDKAAQPQEGGAPQAPAAGK